MLVGGSIMLALVTVRLLIPPDSGVRDIFSVYYGARALLRNGDAYRLGGVLPHHLGTSTLTYLHAGGNVYPLPAVLLLFPLGMVPATLASIGFLVGVSILLYVALRALDANGAVYLYVPLLLSFTLENITALVVTLCLLAVAAQQKGHQRLTGVLLVLAVVIKPVEALLPVAVLGWENRRAWRSMSLALALILAISFAVQPDWLARWVPIAEHRNAGMGDPVHWMWWLIPVAALLWARRDRLGAAVVAQAGLLPSPVVMYPQAWLLLGATDTYRAWLLILGQVLLAPLWPVNRVAAVTTALLLPRVMAGWQRGRHLRKPAPLRRHSLASAGEGVAPPAPKREVTLGHRDLPGKH